MIFFANDQTYTHLQYENITNMHEQKPCTVFFLKKKKEKKKSGLKLLMMHYAKCHVISNHIC